MNTLGTRNTKNGASNRGDNNVPLMLKNETKEISLGTALFLSTIAHPAIVAFLWLLCKAILLFLAFLGITLPIFEKPPTHPKDIEFILTHQAEQPPVNKNTKYRAEKNSRAGGKFDPKKAVTEPESQISHSAPQHESPQQQQQPQHHTANQQKQAQKSSPKRTSNNSPIPPRPMPMNTYPRPRISHNSHFSIPVPKSRSFGPMSPRGGPVTSGPISDSSQGQSPSPVMQSGGYSRGRRSHGYSPGSGNPGNPSPGNPNARPGIDALREPDYGPFMADLKRRIKRNWSPPKGDESKRVILVFRVNKDGTLHHSGIVIRRSSGSRAADDAARAAVELSAPFRPLPPEHRGPAQEIEFTFDYNVIGVGARIR